MGDISSNVTGWDPLGYVSVPLLYNKPPQNLVAYCQCLWAQNLDREHREGLSLLHDAWILSWAAGTSIISGLWGAQAFLQYWQLRTTRTNVPREPGGSFMTFSDPASDIRNHLFCCITIKSLTQPEFKGRRHRPHLYVGRESRNVWTYFKATTKS